MEKRKRLKIGFFGGSFDPIHLGHLRLAEELMEIEGLDEVWFSPARISPHKLMSQPASPEDRVAMIRLAIEGHPKFQLYEGEVKVEGPSYTVNTLRSLTKDFPENQFYLIMSEEALPAFPKWKDPETIVSLCPLLIGSRNGQTSTLSKLEGGGEILSKAIDAGWRQTTPLEISSTDIRSRIQNKVDISEMVPKKVMDYIYRNDLYLRI